MFEDIIKNKKMKIDWPNNIKFEFKKIEFENLVTNLINLNKRHRINKILIPYESYLKEYCTVRVDIGRQIGKTHYIISNATKNDCIIVHNVATKRNIKIFTKAKVYTIKNIYNKIPGNIFKNIWIDEASWMDNNIKNLDFLYSLFANKSVEQTFIFFG